MSAGGWSGQPQPKVPKSFWHLRKALVERFDISEYVAPEAPDGPEGETMCCCIPLRGAVFLSALCHLVISWGVVLAKGSMHALLRVYTGGYAIWSRALLDLVNVAGVLFAALGVIGAVYMKTSYIRAFQIYMLVHIPVGVVVYFFDIPLLWACELWKTDIKEAQARFGWSSAVYEVALAERCSEERAAFLIHTGFSFCFLVYIVSGTQRFLDIIDEEPRYVHRLPKEAPSGAFRAIGVGAASARPQYGAAEADSVGSAPWFPPNPPQPQLVGAPVQWSPGFPMPPPPAMMQI